MFVSKIVREERRSPMIRTSLVVLTALFACLSNAQTVSFSFTAPEGAELEKYPVMPGPLSVADQAKLGLAAKTLDRPVDFFNHYRNVRNGRFVFETLPAGTIVLASADGKPRYKADCGNRLVEPAKCPTCPPVKNDSVADTLGGKKSSPTNGASTPGAWSRFWDNVDKSWGSMWGGLGSLLGSLLPLLLLLGLLGLIAYAIARAIQNRRGNGGATATATAVQNPPAPNPPPGPVTTAQPVQQTQTVPPLPQQAPATTAATPTNPPASFPAGRAIIDLGDANSATRIQAGQNFSRIEFNEDPTDGSTTIRIFRR